MSYTRPSVTAPDPGVFVSLQDAIEGVSIFDPFRDRRSVCFKLESILEVLPAASADWGVNGDGSLFVLLVRSKIDESYVSGAVSSVIVDAVEGRPCLLYMVPARQCLDEFEERTLGFPETGDATASVVVVLGTFRIVAPLVNAAPAVSPVSSEPVVGDEVGIDPVVSPAGHTGEGLAVLKILERDCFALAAFAFDGNHPKARRSFAPEARTNLGSMPPSCSSSRQECSCSWHAGTIPLSVRTR